MPATDYMLGDLPVKGAPAGDDYIPVLDVHDTTTAPANATGSNKRSLARNVTAAGVTLLRSPAGLRRWRAAFGDAQFANVPVVCVGDSITAGQGADNITSTFNNIPDNTNGWVGQLRKLLANEHGADPGEGFIFADDTRVTNNGGIGNVWACTPLTHGYRLTGTQNLVLTVPAGITRLGIIQANQTQAFNAAGSNLADVSGLYSQTGSATVTNAAITTLTNTGRALVTEITVAAGDVITVSAPATAQTYIAGFNLRSGNAGVLVHRVAVPGYTSGDMLGGQTSGVLNQAASPSNQVTAARACYDWAGTTGLVTVSMLGNDQQFQAGGGTARQNGVTLANYTAWMTQFMSQAISDGWSVLMFAPPRNPSAYTGGPSEDAYLAAMQSYALSTDHVSYLDTGELWGSYSASAALNLTDGTSVHPLRRGHGDMARMVYRAVVSVAAGVTALTGA